MATGDTFDSRIIAGLAQLLEGAGLGVWRDDGSAYDLAEVAIIDRDVPTLPDKIITLTDYPIDNAADGLADYELGVQIRVRGTTDPRVCRDLASEIYDLLEASGFQLLGSGADEVAIVDIRRQSYTSQTSDPQGRWESSHNYYVAAMRPTAYRSE